jgi:hypothetical protein
VIGMAQQTKLPAWRRTESGNAYLGCYDLKVVIFQPRNGSWNFNVLGLPNSPVWGPGFQSEHDCCVAAKAAFAEYRHAKDWATEGERAFLESVRDGSGDKWLEEKSADVKIETG